MQFQDMCTHNAVTTIPAALSAAASMLLTMFFKLLSVVVGTGFAAGFVYFVFCL